MSRAESNASGNPCGLPAPGPATSRASRWRSRRARARRADKQRSREDQRTRCRSAGLLATCGDDRGKQAMTTVVLGAGVVGTATAWYLRKSGHDVVLIERQAEAAMETSWGNGGIIHASEV